MRRRGFVNAVTGAAVGAAVGTPRPRLGQTDVGRFQAEYADIITQDQRIGGALAIENRAVELAMGIKSSLVSRDPVHVSSSCY